MKDLPEYNPRGETFIIPSLRRWTRLVPGMEFIEFTTKITESSQLQILKGSFQFLGLPPLYLMKWL